MATWLTAGESSVPSAEDTIMRMITFTRYDSTLCAQATKLGPCLPVFGARRATLWGRTLGSRPVSVDTGTLVSMFAWPPLNCGGLGTSEGARSAMGSCVLRETIRNVVRGLLRAFLYVLLTRRRGANAAHTQMGRPTHCLPTRYLRKYTHTNTSPTG
jgi:hypothetical protein